MSYSLSGGYTGNSTYTPASFYQQPKTGQDMARTAYESIANQQDTTYVTECTTQNPDSFYFSPSTFLDPRRPIPEVITEKNKEEIMGLVRETFEKRTGEKFPQDRIIISIGNKESLQKWHELSGGTWQEGIQGFALNSNSAEPHRIFVRSSPKDQMLLTLGHEIGHVMTKTLDNAYNEEAKAFAFSLAWMETIVEHNIGGLSSFVNPQPAENGLHNVAFDFVMNALSKGKSAMETFVDIVNKALRMEVAA